MRLALSLFTRLNPCLVWVKVWVCRGLGRALKLWKGRNRVTLSLRLCITCVILWGETLLVRKLRLKTLTLLKLVVWTVLSPLCSAFETDIAVT